MEETENDRWHNCASYAKGTVYVKTLRAKLQRNLNVKRSVFMLRLNHGTGAAVLRWWYGNGMRTFL